MKLCGSILHFLPLFSFSAMQWHDRGLVVVKFSFQLVGELNSVLQGRVLACSCGHGFQATFSASALSMKLLFLWLPFVSQVCFYFLIDSKFRKRKGDYLLSSASCNRRNRGWTKGIIIWGWKRPQKMSRSILYKKRNCILESLAYLRSQLQLIEVLNTAYSEIFLFLNKHTMVMGK